MNIIGVDPGKTGGIAILDDDGELMMIEDVPVLKVGKRTDYDVAQMCFLLNHRGPGEALLAIEQVQSRPGEGVAGMLGYGAGFGMWLGAAAMAGIRIERVAPQAWKRVMMAGRPKEKAASIQRATELFPHSARWFSRKKDHGRADALLIAEYARRTFGAAVVTLALLVSCVPVGAQQPPLPYVLA